MQCRLSTGPGELRFVKNVLCINAIYMQQRIAVHRATEVEVKMNLRRITNCRIRKKIHARHHSDKFCSTFFTYYLIQPSPLQYPYRHKPLAERPQCRVGPSEMIWEPGIGGADPKKGRETPRGGPIDDRTYYIFRALRQTTR